MDRNKIHDTTTRTSLSMTSSGKRAAAPLALSRPILFSIPRAGRWLVAYCLLVVDWPATWTGGYCGKRYSSPRISTNEITSMLVSFLFDTRFVTQIHHTTTTTPRHAKQFFVSGPVQTEALTSITLSTGSSD
jgi:hypothetical protein